MALAQISLDAQAEAFSVQESPRPAESSQIWSREVTRGPLLPSRGTRARQWHLRQYWHHDYNTLFRGAVAGLIKRVQSTPWEVVAPPGVNLFWQHLLLRADFGDWDRFLAKLIVDYSRYDSGAWVELIAPGDPTTLPTGPVSGLAVLDSLRVYPTGNPTYPAIYYNRLGEMHLLHRSRVVQFVDTPESEEALAGYGDCALSRAVAPVHREILAGRYIETFLDDKPPPGLALFGNLAQPMVEQALGHLNRRERTDAGNEWGHVVELYGADAEVTPTVEFVSYRAAPEKFDFTTYTSLNAKQIALAIGLDIMDIWELTGEGIGTARQSKTLGQKSRGKALGRILKALERLINQTLPRDAAFRWGYRDPEEDIEAAEKADTWTTTLKTAVADTGILTADEGRVVLANQVPAVGEVLRDEEGQVAAIDDADPKPSSASEDTVGGAPEPRAETPPDEKALSDGLVIKALASTMDAFERQFKAFVRLGERGRFNAGLMRATFRQELREAGERAYDDGLRDGGVEPATADAVTKAARRREIAEWLALQNTFINNLVRDVEVGKVTRATAPRRALMWSNKSLRAIYYAGLLAAEGRQKYVWRLGDTVDHCQTCLTLNGQVHTLKAWMRSGFTPGCTCLECKGFNCDCRFEKATGPARGRLPGTGLARLFDTFSGFIHRLAGLVGKAHTGEEDEDRPPTPKDIWARFLQRMALAREVAHAL